MRILVMIIAVLAFLGGLANVVGGMMGCVAGISMLITKFPPQVVQASEMSPRTIGFILLFSAILMFINGLLFVVFALGAFKRKAWARILGIAAYALNIVVCLLTMIFSTVQGSMIPWIVGIFVALVFIIILIISKNAFEKPLK